MHLSLSRFHQSATGSARFGATLLAVGCAFLLSIASAHAATPIAKKVFDIPADAAARSLKRFSEQAGLQVIFPSQIATGIRTRAIKGEMTPRDALATMLADTGLVLIEDDKTGAFAVRRESADEAKNDQRAAPATPSDRPRQDRDSESRAAEKTIELSPFVVSTDKDVGYLAANTLSGSRLNTSLFDTPASISELTPEFLADINANDVTAAVNYSLGFENDTPGNNDNLSQFQAGSVTAVARGLGRSRVASRDYFPLGLNHDVFSIERISESRGPNAILFGLGNAGGIINTSSKRARFQDAGELIFKVDDNGGWRAAIDYNKKLRSNLAVRVNLLSEDQRTWRDLEYTRSKRMQLAGTWKPFERTKVSVQYERGLQDRLAGFRFIGRDFFTPWITAGRNAYNRVTNANTYPTGVVSVGANPYLVMNDAGQVANWQRFGTSERINLGNVGIKLQDETYLPAAAVLTGPAGTTDNDMWLGTVLLEQEIVRNLFVEIGYNQAAQNRDVRQSLQHSHVGLHIDPNVTLPSGATNPYYGQYYIEGFAQRSMQESSGRNWRATVAYELDTRNKWLGRHRWVSLATGALDRGRANVVKEANLTPLRPTGPTALYSNAQNTIFRRTYVSRSGVFGDNGIRAFNQFPFDASPAPAAFSDSANALNGTITPGFFRFNRQNSLNDNESLMIAGQSKVLAERLVLTYGWRRDTLESRVGVLGRNAATNEVTSWGLGPVSSFSGNTRTIGAVVPVRPWFALYANKSDNFSPQSDLDLVGNQIGNVKGEGRDLGVKVSLGGNKLYARAGYYKTATVNQSVRVFTETTQAALIWEAIEGTAGPHYVLFDNTGARFDTQDDVVEGREYEITANPTNGLALTVNLATLTRKAANLGPRTRAYVAEHRALWAANASLQIPSTPGRTVGQALEAIDNAVRQYELGEGQLAQGSYKTSFNAFARYRIQEGPLRDWSAGAGARYRTDRVLGFAADGSPIFSPSFLMVDGNLAYQRRILRNKVGMRLQLNVANVLDNTDLQWSHAQGDGALVDYTLQNPRTFTLTSTFSF